MTRDEALTLRPGDVVTLSRSEVAATWRVVSVRDRTSTVLVLLEKDGGGHALTYCEVVERKGNT